MSVEQPAEDPSTLSTPASDKLVVEKESMHTSASSSSISSASLPSDRAAEVEGPKPPAVEEIVAGLRDWVATLSLKERAVAMSFTDSVLLSAMVGHRLSHPAPPVVMDWEAMVPVSRLADRYTSLGTTSGADDNGPWNARLDSNKDGSLSAQTGEPDDFRIRSLLAGIRVVLLPALQYVAGNAMEPDPVVLLEPACLSATDDLWLALDEEQLAQCWSSTSWPVFLQSLVARDQEATLPLFRLLLVRFQYALVESFREHEAKSRLSKFIHATKSDATKTEEEDSSRYASARENSSSLSDLEPTRSRGSLSSDILTLAASWQDEFMETAAVRDIVGPFGAACHIQDESSLAKMEHLLLTPLVWLVSARREIGELNAVLRVCLERLPSSGTRDLEDEPLPEPSKAVAQGMGKKKKKKSKKKNKHRKLSNASSHAGANESESALDSSEEMAALLAGTKPIDSTVSRSSEANDPKKVPSPRSVDSDDTELSAVADAASERSIMSTEEVPAMTNAPIDGGIAVSRVEGVLFVAASAGKAATASEVSQNGPNQQTGAEEEEDGDAWETVEVRGRGNRKKTANGMRQLQHSTSSFATVGSTAESQGSTSKKKIVRMSNTRKKNASRKIAREILNAVLDTVDDDARRRQQLPKPPAQQQAPSKAATMNAWMGGPPGGRPTPVSVAPVASNATPKMTTRKEPTMRDVVLGRHEVQLTGPEVRKRPSHGEKTQAPSPRADPSSPSKSASSLFRTKVPGASGADQNTAPTYQETVSISASSNFPATVKTSPINEEELLPKSDSSSGENYELPQKQVSALARDLPQSQPVPPLPTLLSPENANSANSSVASSLEVPHTSRRHHHHHHHHNSSVDVNDVGYHLLDVCDRLSRDMSLFMSRRALALNARRRERGALLAALQDTVMKIWAGNGYVEMYGSCATQLDLPSSDLDVVIMGLDRGLVAAQPVQSPIARAKSMGPDNLVRTPSVEEVPGDVAPALGQQARHMSAGSFAPGPLLNGERVRRLAQELAGQAWAVQVNPIPTATVPVVKVLADPSKLTGSSFGGEWMAQHHCLAAEAAAASAAAAARQAAIPSASEVPHGSAVHAQDPRHGFHPPWRGADVMNGLLKLDITFEGPEHGGIGSTLYSSAVVSEACQATGMVPDATPLVQVVMVLKEILAQRKLNEPYSGGLSSYALLLLVVALMRERAVIRQEIERAELQRKAVAAEDGNSSFSVPPQPETPPVAMAKKHDAVVKVQAKSAPKTAQTLSKTTAAVELNRPPQASANSSNVSSKAAPKMMSSWASIARKNSTASSGPAKPSNVEEPRELKKPASFADAVARSSAVPAKKASRDDDAGTKQNSGGTTRAVEAIVKATASAKPEVGANARKNTERTEPAVTATSPLAPTPLDTSLVGSQSFYPQGYNDVIEVLCSGETTPGKLLMHFLLHYGRHFDAQFIAIDISGKHERDIQGQPLPYPFFSPYISRPPGGTMDPITGMLTNDPIVIYDPLEGAEHNNVAKRCFAWNNVRWVFAQSYDTLSSAVERSATPPATPGGKAGRVVTDVMGNMPAAVPPEFVGDLLDPSSPLLRCLLSF